MLTPPGGSLGSTLWVLVGAAVVLPVAPDLVLAGLLEEAVASPLAAAVIVASSAFVDLGVPVSAGEVSESIDNGPLV